MIRVSGVSERDLEARAPQAQALRQAEALGAEILVARKIVRIDPHARRIVLDNEEVLRARTVIVASGVSWRRLKADGFDRLLGKSYSTGAARSEASIAQGLDVHLIGAGNSAGQAAVFFANHARTVTLIVRAESRAEHVAISDRPDPQQIQHLGGAALRGQSRLRRRLLDLRSTLSIRSTNEVRRDSGGLFVFIGADAETGWLPAEMARDPRGYVLTGGDVVKAGRWKESRDPYLVETSVPGVFACGGVEFQPGQALRPPPPSARAASRSPLSMNISQASRPRSATSFLAGTQRPDPAPPYGSCQPLAIPPFAWHRSPHRQAGAEQQRHRRGALRH